MHNEWIVIKPDRVNITATREPRNQKKHVKRFGTNRQSHGDSIVIVAARVEGGGFLCHAQRIENAVVSRAIGYEMTDGGDQGEPNLVVLVSK